MNNRRWVEIDPETPSLIATGDLDQSLRDEAIAAFTKPKRGVQARYNNRNIWYRQSALLPIHLAAGDFDGNGSADLAADFGAAGVSVRIDNRDWEKVLNSPCRGLWIGDLDGDGNDELIANRGSLELWAALLQQHHLGEASGQLAGEPGGRRSGRQRLA